jgi:hypothetical protein
MSDLLMLDAVLSSQEEYRSDCPCPKKCPRHGRCTECREYHGRKNHLPYCERDKKASKPVPPSGH